ncbi:Hypothetical predicted protein [Cloeon dipterum]|uniref:RRM domain-containing protein n=1 Tax=Cloeon dipterum TaxID=197152 RepID=A0A8S1CEY3_9INSE|nr:Hypothetical predicted protein [Cloeon dipterum]
MSDSKAVQQALRRELHRGRFLSIKHLPRQVAEADVRELLSDVDVASVQLVTSASGASAAQVILSAPETLDAWDPDRVFLLRGQRIPVTPAPQLMLLCVANLAPGLADEQLHATLETYGPLVRCFLMRCAATGAPKGYAVAEFALYEHCLRARKALIERGVTCDLLEPSLQTLDELHSKCMLVENLPENFRNLNRLRQVFSPVTSPPYCQLCMTGPRPWGLVEFHSWQDAEATWLAVDGAEVNGCPLKVSFCPPGVRAINLFLQRQEEARSAGGLLPDPPSPLVYRQMQNLASRINFCCHMN